MDLLKRKLAPILPDAWKLIDEEARRVLALNLAGRKVVDFDGPHGWKFAAVNTGQVRALATPAAPDVSTAIRVVQSIVELRTSIRLSTAELDAVARGRSNPDLSEVVAAAERIARAEDGAIFNGYAAAGIDGIMQSSPHAPIDVGSAAEFPAAIVGGKEALRAAGVGGPYALVLGPSAHDELSAGSDDGYPIRKRIERQLIDGPICWAPSIEGAVLLSTRGGDFQLTVGQDLSIGYVFHDRDTVELYLTESFTFQVLEPGAAVVLRRAPS